MESGKDPVTGKFVKGNKIGRGRFAGSKSNAQLFLEQICTDNAEKILIKVIENALLGDLAAAKLILERVMPIRAQTFVKSNAVKDLHTQTDINTAMTEIVSQVGNSELALEEAHLLTQLLIKKKETMDECLHEEVVEMQKKIGML